MLPEIESLGRVVVCEDDDVTRELLIDNPHRVRLTMAPDRDMSTRRSEALSKQLLERKRRLGGEEKARIVEQAYDVWHLQPILFALESFEELVDGFRSWTHSKGLLN